MKQILLVFFVALSHLVGCAQNDSLAMTTSNSIAIHASELVKLQDNKANRYKIYPTENIYILIKLDTHTGRLELIQWSLNTDNEFSATLNGDDLSIYDGLNSFELYPTQNMYQFILLDKATGRNWHVQWGTKSSDLWIRRIY